MQTFSKKRFVLLNAAVAISLLSLVAAPPVFAQQLESIVSQARRLLNIAVAFIFALAAIVFLWGVFSFIAKGHEPAERKKAQGLMIWGIVGMVVMGGFWAIVRAIITYFGVENTTPINPPSLPNFRF